MDEKQSLNNLLNQNEDDRGIATGKLNEYIRFGSAGGYILIGALILAIVALVIWGFTGTIQVTFDETGIVYEGEQNSHSCVCFVDVELNTGILPEGQAASVRTPDGRTLSATMTYFSTTPRSAEELKADFAENTDPGEEHSAFSDWMMDKLLDGCDYAYVMTVETEEDISAYWHQIVQVTVVMDEVRPISFLLR